MSKQEILARNLFIATIIIFAVMVAIFLTVFILDLVKKRKSETKYHLKESLLAFALLLPAVIIAFFVVVLPIIFSLGYAFTDFQYEPQSLTNIQFVGFAQFQEIFKDLQNPNGPLFHSLINTALFVVLVVPLQITLALLLALFCNNKRRGTTIFKVCFFAPVAVSLSVTSFLWLIILSPAEDGIMNSILAQFGIAPQAFLMEEGKVVVWMVIISAWQGCGYQMLIFLSALGNIRKDLYEAASIDGAGTFRKFFTITLPGLRPTLLYILITVFIGACRVMVQPMLLAKNNIYAMTMSYFMYQKGKTEHMIAYSCAVALLLTIFIGSITLIQRKLLGEKKNG